MKKRKLSYRILSFMLCFMCFFFVGCGSGGPSDENDDEYYQNSLEGVKVLSRTTDENYFSTATGLSEYYYNIFASEMLKQLYLVYEDNNSNDIKFGDEVLDAEDETKDILLNDDNGNTFSTFLKAGKENLKYYLYDSLRYTITNIDMILKQNESDGFDVVTYNISLDLGSSWNWDIMYNADDVTSVESEKIAFLNVPYLPSSNISVSGTKIVVSFSGAINDDIMIEEDSYKTDWTKIYGVNIVNEKDMTVPSFINAYIGDEVKLGETGTTNYFQSPFYEKEVEGKTEVTAKNFYQDALEYVTYLFVLGYDYENAEGQPTTEAVKFEFTPEYSADGYVSDIKVGGVSVGVALKQIKEEYKQTGNFVGITDKNKEQLKRFILDKVIGDQALAKDIFSVVAKTQKQDKNGVAMAGETITEEIKFNRNYDKIVEFIVGYACEQAPIGTDEEGNPVTLDNAYMASTITDYNGEYFFAADDEEGSIFRYIGAAEYQSMVLMPIAEDVGKRLTDIHIVFEYQDYDTSDTRICNADGLDLVVGLRYFNGTTGTYTYINQTSMKVLAGDNAVISEDNPDLNTVIFSEDDYEDDAFVKINQEIIIGSQFKNPDEINPAKYTTDPIGDLASMTIKGNSVARDYYNINNSASGVGFYGSLNGQKMIESGNACDFIEVYFDIQKVKGATNVSYDFKLALLSYYAMGEED